MRKLVVLFVFLLNTLCVCAAESRLALLIANGTYKNFSSLATPVKEARDLKKSLETLGFSVVIVENASREKMSDALYDFQKRLEKSGGIGFFHYGGHAVQVSGKNYLIPSDADIPDERRIASRALDCDEIMASIKPRMRELAASELAASCSLLPRRKAMDVVAPTPMPSPAHIISP